MKKREQREQIRSGMEQFYEENLSDNEKKLKKLIDKLDTQGQALLARLNAHAKFNHVSGPNRFIWTGADLQLVDPNRYIDNWREIENRPRDQMALAAYIFILQQGFNPDEYYIGISESSRSIQFETNGVLKKGQTYHINKQ